DDQPADEVDVADEADQPKPSDDAQSPEAEDDADADQPMAKPKVKVEAGTDDGETLDAKAIVATVPQHAVQAKDQPVTSDEAEHKAARSAQTQVRAVSQSDTKQPGAAKAKADKSIEDDASTGAIDLSDLEAVASDDDADDATNDLANQPQVTSDVKAGPAAQAAAPLQSKVQPLSQAVAIQPVQTQEQKSSSSSQQQMSGESDLSQQQADMDALSEISDASEPTADVQAHAKPTTPTGDAPELAMMTAKMPETAGATKATQPAPPPAPVPPEVQFASTNHDKIITGLRSELLPSGGTMHIRLDPPELGALQVRVTMQDGVMTAAFETSNDDATKLLSHSLSQLKHALESQGVSVDKLHVQQSPRNESTSNQKDENGGQSQAENHRSSQQEQQRKEMIRRMWRRLGVGYDPLDMVA
ncbi:MAG TPA: flagellar hook-length control protein FliK, partial [Tepidisphaeraceae bacterium]|nr:flagellar hook-length control protein FliK [Tepidisphaeraceae bacterium]